MRVIQDSDDDSGSDIEVNGSKDAPPVPLERVKDASSGATGSTESLKRAFAKAHHDHLQSPSGQDAGPSAKEPQSSVSLPEHPSKRKKISEKSHGAIVPTPENFAKPVTHPTTGSVREDYPPTEPFYHQINNQAISHGAGIANFMDLSDTTRQEYAQHEPMALFPEPSSTIANATQTQQKLLEGIVGPGLLGEGCDSAPSQLQHHPQPSVPWSEILNFSPAGAGEQSDSNQRSEEATETHVQASERTQDTSISQPVRRGSSVQPGHSTQRFEVASEHINLQESTPLHYAAGQHRNLQPVFHITQAEQNTPRSSKISQRKQVDVYEIQSSDDEPNDMPPEEQYKPRPSRSRSLKVDSNEPVDYSIRPEKAVKGIKRRKPTRSATTTRSASANDAIGTPQKVKQICEMGFTPTSTGKALKQNHGDVTQTIEWLINNGMAEDELARPNTPKRKPPPKVVATNQTNVADESSALKVLVVEVTTSASKSLGPAVVSEPQSNPPDPQEIVHSHMNEPMVSHVDNSKSPKVQVVIPSKSPRTKSIQKETEPPESSASKKSKRRKTTSDLPEPDAGRGLPEVPEPKTEKKKRGRPKKVANASVPSKAIEEGRVETNVPSKVPTEEENISSDVHQTIEGGAEGPPTLVEPGGSKVEDAPNSPAPPSKEPSAQRPSTTSHTPEQTKKTPSRSPTSKGKVSYRVGLSRRARIAPLLRIAPKK